VYTAQKQLGRDAQLAAAEIVRRAEQGIGVTIRRGQEHGEIRRRGQGGGQPPRSARPRTDKTMSSPADFATITELRGNGAGIYHLTDRVSDAEFEAALAAAKAEQDLSRANVVRKLRQRRDPSPGPDGPGADSGAPVLGAAGRWRGPDNTVAVSGGASPAASAARPDLIAELAATGMTSPQIACRLGIRADRVRAIAHEHQITIRADQVVGRARRLDSNRIARGTVPALAGLAMGVELASPAEIDPAQAPEWTTSAAQFLAGAVQVLPRIEGEQPVRRNVTPGKGRPADRIERDARLRWVPLRAMRVNPLAQRNLNQARVAQLAACFDPEQMGTPVVSHRGDSYHVVDGQHRIEAFKLWMGSWEDQEIQCWCYEGLSEPAEAGKFLALNDTLTVRAVDKFKVAVEAGREAEADLDRITRAVGLRIAASRADGGISEVATLRKVHARGGPAVLSRALRIIRDSYGEAGLDGPVIDGIAVVCQRYDGDLSEQRAVERLSAAHGGVSGLVSRAGQLRQATARDRAQCVASAAVEIINRGAGGKKLPSWWRGRP
jgi:hypothetical protein